MIDRKKIFLIAILLLVTFSGTACAAIITVDPSGGADYTTIQNAINGAVAGDTINVQSGTYIENVNVNKQLFLHGVNTGGGNPIVNGSGVNDVVILSADGITFDNFTVTNAGYYSGIKINSNNNTITDINASVRNYYGIYSYNTKNNTFRNINASNNIYMGIYLESVQNNNITALTANNNNYGLYLYDVQNNNFTSITANNNYYGLMVYYIQNSNFEDINASNNNYYGLYLYSAQNNNITGVNASNNNYYYGIYLYGSYNRITNSTANNNNYGLYLDSSNYNNITGNNFSANTNIGVYISYSSENNFSVINSSNNNNYGIYLYGSNNKITNSTANNNYYGLYLDSSNYNNMIGNNFSGNTYTGIYISYSTENNFSENKMSGNKYNFYLYGYSDYHFNNTIDKSNIVDNKSIYYLKDEVDTNYDASSNPGLIYCIRCNNVTFKDAILANNYYGVYFWNTHNSSLLNINSSNNDYGIYFSSSSNNSISGSTASNNYEGIYLDSASNTRITGDNVSNNNYNGIYIYNSEKNNLSDINVSSNGNYGLNLNYVNYNQISGIKADNNYQGIYLYGSNNNIITNTNVNNSANEGVYVYSSYYNNLSGISSHNNTDGFQIYYSNNNDIAGNNASDNTNFGIYIEYSSENHLIGNMMVGNKYNFNLVGSSDYYFNNTIETSNTVDGKTVYYLKDKVDTYYDTSSNAGLIYCIRCNNVTFQDVTLAKNYYGAYFWNTYNSSLSNINSSNNYYGIYFSSSSNNDITGSTVSNNNEGIYFDSSGNNKITSNNVINNYDNGIQLSYSDNNEFNNNTAIGNIYLDFNVYGTVNTGDNNTCDRPDGWNDNGTIGCKNLSMPVINYPDFIVTELTWSPASFNVSEYVTINATIQNVGVYFNGDISTGFYLDGESINEVTTYATLDTDQVMNVSFSWYVNKNGNGRILSAKADFNNHWAEQNESNNYMNVTLPNIAAPDLIVENITWQPDPFSVGDSVRFNATVRNIGDASTPYTSIYVMFYVDGTRVYYYPSYWGGSLAPGESFTILSQSYWTASSGQHSVQANADYYNYVAESNETNNELNISLPAAKMSDLIIQNITWSPESPTLGNSVTFTATVKNIGNGISPSDYNYVRFFIDGNYISQNYYYGSIAPGTTQNITVSWTALPGNHTIKASADYYDYVVESNETNNDLNVSLPYISGPDLIVENIIWSPSNYSAGNQVTFTARINNIGEASTPNTYIYVRFLIDGNSISEPYLYGSLAAGSNFTINGIWQSSLPGSHKIKAYVDIYNYVTESNETNNELSIDLPFVPGPDLVIDDITWSPLNYTPGQTVTFSANIMNSGTRNTTSAFYTMFYVDGSYLDYYGTYYPTVINSGDSASVTQTWVAQGGNHSVSAKADCYYNCNYPSIAEVNETNNDKLVVLPQVDLPDLIITDITWTPNTYSAGDPVILNATVMNNGTGSWNGPVRVDFYYKNTTTITPAYSVTPTMSLPPGDVGYAVVTWSPAQAGDFYFRGQVDSNNNIIESNESNNNYYLRNNNLSKPDLGIENISISSSGIGSIQAGDVITINASIKNYGPGDLSSWNIPTAFYVDGAGLDPSVYKILSIPANGTGYVTRTWTATPGNHSISATVDMKREYTCYYSCYYYDAGGIVDESNESNNSMTINLPAISYPDLVVEDITWSPLNYEAGQSVTIYATIRNIGTGNAYSPNGFYTMFYVDGSYLYYYGTYYGSIIRPGDRVNVTQTWTGQGGNHTVTASADTSYYYYYGNTIQEANESNNSLTKNLTSISYPDLIVTKVLATKNGVTTNISQFNASDGESITFNATIMNIGPGNISATNLYAGFYIDGGRVATGSVNQELPVNGMVNISGTWTATPGNHTFIARADPDNGFQEASESNNDYSTALNLIPFSDLMVSNLSWSPARLSDGQVVIFNATIQNIGAGNTSRPFWTRFYVNDTEYIGDQYVNSGLNSGNSAVVSQGWNAVFGKKKVTVTVDYSNNVMESNQSNNSLSANLSFIEDQYPPQIISVYSVPTDLTENTSNPEFYVVATDIGYGIDPAMVYLNYSAGGVSSTKQAVFISGNSYKVILNGFDLNFDAHQGETLAYNFIVYDRGENRVESNMSYEYIDIINDVPSITIQSPTSASRWKGVHAINWTVNNDNEGSTNSTLYYWKPAPWAPSYLENRTNYFKQGEWIFIATYTQSGMDSLLWDTTGWSGYTRIKVEATDGTFTVSEHSNDFVIDNEGVLIELKNYMADAAYLTTRNPTIRGVVEGTFTNINQININSSDFNLTVSPISKLNGDFEFSSDLNYSGTYTLNITATDEAGNTGYLAALFLVDPELPVVQSAGFMNLFTDNLVEIVVNATDNYSVDVVSASVFGKTINLNLSLDGMYHGSVLAPSGESTYPAEIFVRDVAGNRNSSRYNLTILTGPDLEVNASGISFDPMTPLTGQHLNITARINNLGSANVEFANVTFLANDRMIGSQKVNLTASPDVNFNWNTTGFAGNVTIGVRIERSTNYSETNYSNNFASKEIFIDGPDLTVTNIAFNPVSPVYEGQVVTITATIVNLKPFDANNVKISFYENALNLSNRIDFKDVNLPASSSVNVSVNWQTAGLSGMQTIFAEANTNDLPAEVDRSNNVLTSQFETKKYIAEQIPDLIIFPQKPLPAIPGEKIRGMASNDFDQDNKTDFVAGTDIGKIILYRNNGVFYTNNNKTKNVNFTQNLIDDIGEAAWGMTSGDLLGDNYPDIIVGTESGKVIFYNNSNGTFSNKTILLDVGDQAYGLAISDFNNDNKFDIVVSNKKGQVNLYLNNMTGNVLTNESMVFSRTLTTRNQPFGLTTGDFDLDGHSDVMVGDGDGQIERIVWEIDRYNGFLFADVGSYAHGLTAADVDYSGKLDLFSTSFDGKVRMFFSREGGLVADPLIIGNVPESYGITSGDYDSDNDIDVIVGSDNGNVTMLMNSLRILKSTTPSPSPPRREMETTTHIQNPWAREMIDLNLTESWIDDVSFVKGGEMVCLDDYCDTKFYGDVYLYETPRDNSTYNVHYYVNFSNKVGPVIKVLKIEYKYVPGYYYGWEKVITYIDYNEKAILNDSSFELPKILSIFDNLDMLRLREGFKYQYKFIPGSVTNVSAITNVNYSLFGSFNTPNTDYLLSDDVTNLNNAMANTRNINPSRIKTDRDYVDDLVIAPDFTPTNLIFQGYSYPPVPGMSITAVATIKNLNDIAINNAKVMLLIDNIPVKFGCPTNCVNYTTFNIGAKGTTTLSTSTNLPMSVGTSVNVTVVVNPYRDEIETNYDNNNISNSISTLPPSDLRNDGVYFSNGSVFKNVFVEGEPIKIYTDISNIGTNKSFSEDVFFIGAPALSYYPPCCGNIAPVDLIGNCSSGDSNYNEGLCDGFIERYYSPYQLTSPGNIEPGASVSTNISNVLGDFKLRSHGVYNVTSIVSNAGSLDENHANDANFSQLIVLPGQEDIQFYYPSCDLNYLEKIYLGNPDGNNMSFNYGEINIGGYDVSNYDSVAYLDNNDSVIYGRVVNETLANHTSDNRYVTIDWSLVPPGDHKVNFYLDYGKNASESTAKAVSSEGLIIKAGKSGVSGNGLSISIQNITSDTFRLVITNKTEIVELTEFDLQTRTETQTISYDQKLGHSEIRTVGDIVEIIQNGGYASGTFIPSGILAVETNGADLVAKPAIQTLNLVIPGSLTNERSDFNNQHSTIFRWKELVLKDIKFNPVFPSSKDIVTISSTIKNEGDIRTGAFNVTMYVDGLPVSTKNVSLLAHDTQSVSFLYTIPQSEQISYNVRIEADPENKIMKEDKRDNNLTTSISVSAPFELNVFSREHNINFLSGYRNDASNNFTASSFGLDNISMEYDTVPAFADYDSDLDQDLITGSLDGRLVSYDNIGTEVSPEFRETNWSNVDWKPEEVPNVMIGTKYYNNVNLSSLDVGARSAPEFVDLDNDSLMDMVIGDTHGRLRSFKSAIVVKNSVKKRVWVEFDFNLSKIDQVLKAVPRFADLDGDGDPDLIVGNQFGKLGGYENIGNATNPDWQHKDFNLSAIDAGANAALAIGDIDLDGDNDLVVGNRNYVSIYENIGNRTDPAWQKLDPAISIPGRTEYRPDLADLDGDGYPDLISGSNNFTQMKLRKGYFEPVNVQIINYAKNQIDIARISLSVLDATSKNRITDLMLDGPFNHYVGYDNILNGYRIGSQEVLEKEYDLNIPGDLPDNTILGVRASKQENVNPAYFYELNSNGGWVRGEKPDAVFINRPEIGGNTFDLFVEPGTTYEYRGSYRVFHNGTMSQQFDCIQNWCAMYNLTGGSVNTIVGSGEIRRLIHLSKTNYDIVIPDEPPIVLELSNKTDLNLKTGYIEDIDLSIKNNNRRPYTIDRIALELYDNSGASWNGTNIDETKIIDLFTDTTGFTLPPEQVTQKTYKVYIPDGVPTGAALHVKAIEKHALADNEFYRSNIRDIWPQGSNTFSDNIAQANLYNNSNISLYTDLLPWGFQGFDYGMGCEGCGAETSFLRKLVWVPTNLIKSEQKEYLHQGCEYYYESPSGITTWINGILKSSLATACDEITYGWTPNYYELSTGKNNELDLFTFGPHRQFDIMFYEMVAQDNRSNATVKPEIVALDMNVTDIGNHGLLRRQYEEKVNVTVTNNDDDPATVDAVTMQLITPQNKKIQLMTDTIPRTVPGGAKLNLTYIVLIPGDVPLNSKLSVQVERVFEFPDKLWNRNREITIPELLADGTMDYHWGDTLPTTEISKYRKRYFAPINATRAEMILGDRTGTTDAYLNGEFQGSGYPGWSSMSLSSGLKQGQLNLLSINGAIPDTESRIYSGLLKTGGMVIEPEEEVYFAVFGIREQQYLPGREPFFVRPGERVTARIRIENKYNKTLNYAMKLYVVDFANQKEITLATQTLTVRPFEIKKLEVPLVIPDTVSNDTRLQLSSVWNEVLSDKNWLRGSNFNDAQASNNYLDDSQWGVVEAGPDNERAIYFRKHLWIDSTVQGIKVSKTGVAKMWVNGLEVAGDTLKNEFTKSESNLIALKATDFNIDADLTLEHFVPVRSTDLDSINLNYSSMFILSQDNVTFENQSKYDCTNQTLGECLYKVEKGEIVKLNFTLRNAGELFARDFNLTVFARNVDTGKVTEFSRETIIMHPFSTDDWNVSWNTSKLTGGMYEFIVFPDANDDIIETSEFNNQIVRKIYVNAPPEVTYLYSDPIQGYNENVSITARILDEDGNLANITLNLTQPDNTTLTLNLSGSGNIYSTYFNNTKQGRYSLDIDAVDGYGKIANDSRNFDLFDSMYLNVKTTKDLYFYTQKVRLIPPQLANSTKLAPNNKPVLAGAFDNVERIKGGERITINTNAFDTDGDLMTLLVCKENQAGSSGCTGGITKTYCESNGLFNPACSFNTQKDDILHEWFAFVVDNKGAVSGPATGNYTTDSTPPVTKLYSLAGDRNNSVDTLDDSKTIVTIQGEEGMNCRIGKDPINRFHKDRSYSFLEKECSTSNGFANCNLGNLKKDDPSRDRITNLTRAYVSCTDALGNEQSTIQNLDIEFGIEPQDTIFDDYQGDILTPGSIVNISGSTRYCVDPDGTCSPDIAIENSSVMFSQSGVQHLRYLDPGNNIKETTVFINSRPNVSLQTFTDRLGKHAFEVSVRVSDADDQAIACSLDAGTIQYMAVHNGIATATLTGEKGENATTQVSCTDGFETVTTSSALHNFPDAAPMLRNIPDISLEAGETVGIGMRYFGFDLENDTLVYSVVTQGDTATAMARITSENLSVNGITPGTSNICLKGNDGIADSNVQCVNVFVEDALVSKLKNNEFTDTTIRLTMHIQHFDGNWQDEFSRETKLKVLPGATNEIDLSTLFEWDTINATNKSGLFRVLFRAVDENNNTLINRDGREIIDSYNFTLALFNTPPNISGIPDQLVFENEPVPNIDLLDYSSDSEQNIEDLEYAIFNQTDPGLVNCSITGGHFISCVPTSNMTGTSVINVSAFDGFEFGYAAFEIKIIPYGDFIKGGNITYTFISDQFNVSGDPYSGSRDVLAGENVPAGYYNITVIVSDGFLNVSKNITVLVALPGTQVLDYIGNKVVHENESLFIQLNATDPDGNTLKYGINTSLPSLFSFNETNGSFEWTPGFDDSGNYSVTFNVTNGNFTANETMNITVLNTNRAPILEFIPDIEANESDLIMISANATDPDNENSVSNDDNNLTVFINDLRFTKTGNDFKWLTGFNDSGNYSVIITVADGELSDQQEVNITVLNVEPNLTSPIVIDHSPTGSNISVDSRINVTFNKPMIGTSVENAFRILPITNGTFNWTDNSLTFIPEYLGYNVTYNVTITEDAEDIDGLNLISNFSWEFTTMENINRPPGSVSDLHNVSYATTYINWTWLDPADADLKEISVYVNGTFMYNVTKGVQYYNATDLVPDTEYEISTRTIDTSGNINHTWQNHTAKTALLPDTTPPGSVSGLHNISYAMTYINWTWFDPDDTDFDYVEVYLDGIFTENVLKGKQYFNATNQASESEHTISTRTVDTTGNFNLTWENRTARTKAPIPQDTTAPVIDSFKLYPANTTAGTIINISIRASDYVGVVEVTANGTNLVYSDGVWYGSIKAASSVGNYTVSIRAKDIAGNVAQRSANYTVVYRVGGIAVTSIPKPLSIVQGAAGVLTIKLISTANIDDIVEFTINTNGITSTSAIDLSWFNRTFVRVQVPSRATIYIPFTVAVPPGTATGYKTFKNNAKSLGFNATSVDTGMVNVKP